MHLFAYKVELPSSSKEGVKRTPMFKVLSLKDIITKEHSVSNVKEEYYLVLVDPRLYLSVTVE